MNEVTKAPEDDTRHHGHQTSLAEVRRAIDRIDREIVRLLGERSVQVQAAARLKGDEASVRAPERVRRMVSERRAWAEAEGLDADFVESLFRAVTDHFIARELTLWQGSNPPAPSDTPDAEFNPDRR